MAKDISSERKVEEFQRKIECGEIDAKEMFEAVIERSKRSLPSRVRKEA